MPAFRPIVLSLFFSFAAFPALACTPCLTKSPIDRSISQALIIAHVINKDQNCSASLTSGPAVVRLTIKNIFKGTVDEDKLDVHSWYGECPYGVHLPLGGEAVVLLQEVTDIYTGEWDGTYKLVEDGCSAGQLDVLRENLHLNGRSMPINSFVSKYIP